MSTAAIGTAEQRIGHFAEALFTPAGHFDFLLEAEKLFDDFGIQFEGGRAVGPQNIRHRAALA